MTSVALPEESDYVPQQIEFAVRGLTNHLEKDDMKAFGKLPDGRACFEYVATLKQVDEVIDLEEEFLGKNLEVAKESRLEGNKHFKAKSYLTAAQAYSKSIVYAPQEGPEGEEWKDMVALAYANRSAAWFHLKRYHFSLTDIEMAIVHDYPPDMHYKLLERQGRCLAALGQPAAAVESLEKALVALGQAKVEGKQLKRWEGDITAALEKAKQQSEAEGEKPVPLPGSREVPKLKRGPQKNFPCFSDTCRIDFKQEEGRHVVANEDVRAGDVLMVDKPYASALLSQHYYNHCYHCYSRPWTPVPCPTCATVIYCSRKCQQESFEQFHRWECRWQSFFGAFWCGRLGHVAARAIMRRGMAGLLQDLDDLGEVDDEPKGITVGVQGTVYQNDFKALYSLASMTKTRTPEGLFDYTVFSYFIVRLLERSGWMAAQAAKDGVSYGGPARCRLGAALLRLLQVLQNNIHGVLELQSPSDFEKPTPTEIAMGIYPSAALINHGCHASADLTYFGDTAVLRATRDMWKGQEATIEYLGLSFMHMERQKRQVVLRANFGFVCTCVACREHYPEWKKLDAELPWFICSSCHKDLDVTKMEEKDDDKFVRCEGCGSKEDLRTALNALQASHEEYSKGMELAMSSKAEEALPGLAEHLTLMQTYMAMPWRDLAACQSAITACYRQLANVRTHFQDTAIA